MQPRHTPTDLAKEIISKSELHDRRLYTGYIGIIGPAKFEFFVNLRCMQITNNAAYLYLGGGLTIDSELGREWNETQRKAKTLEQVLTR